MDVSLSDFHRFVHSNRVFCADQCPTIPSCCLLPLMATKNRLPASSASRQFQQKLLVTCIVSHRREAYAVGEQQRFTYRVHFPKRCLRFAFVGSTEVVANHEGSQRVPAIDYSFASPPFLDLVAGIQQIRNLSRQHSWPGLTFRLNLFPSRIRDHFFLSNHLQLTRPSNNP